MPDSEMLMTYEAARTAARKAKRIMAQVEISPGQVVQLKVPKVAVESILHRYKGYPIRCRWGKVNTTTLVIG